MAKSEVTIKDNGEIQGMLDDLFTHDLGIKIGLVGKPEEGAARGSDAKMYKDADGEIHFNDNVDVAYIAAVHEFGDEKSGIPQRSFLRSTFDEKIERLYKNVAKDIRKQVNQDKYDPKVVLRDAGVWMVGQVKKKFTNNTWDKLQDPTRGGRNFEGTATPLVDTNQLRGSIDYEIVKKGDL